MAKPSSKKARGPSLGVNFEHGLDGGVVVYDGHTEVLLALLPPETPITVKEANALAVAYKKVGKVLDTAQSLRIVTNLRKKPKTPKLDLA